MSKQLFDLCTLVVKDLFGALVADIYAVILNRGRTDVEQISRSLKLPPPTVRNVLIILLQQRLVYYDDDDSPESYEANLDAAYSLIRTGRNVELVHEKFGHKSSAILADLCLTGCTPLGEHVHSWSNNNELSTDQSGERGHVNGNHAANGLHDDQGEPESSQQAKKYRGFSDLATSQIIRGVGDFDFTSQADFIATIEQQLVRERVEGFDSKTGIKRVAFLREAKKRQRNIRDDNPLRLMAERAQTAQTDFVEGRKTKKRKLNNDRTAHKDFAKSPAEIEDESDRSLRAFTSSANEQSTMAIRPDQEKLNVLARSQLLVDTAMRYLGPSTSKVYSAALQLAEENVLRCYDPYGSEAEDLDEADPGRDKNQSIVLSTEKIAERLPNDFDADKGTTSGKDKRHEHANVDQPSTNGGTAQTVNGETSPNRKRKHEPEESKDKLVRVEEHLHLLKSHSKRFLRQHHHHHHHHHRPRTSPTGQDTWSVPFDRLSKALVEEYLVATIMSHFGRTAARLTRILIDKGRLDDKQLSTIALIPQRNVRELLNDLQAAGFVGIQEVPRENSRQPSRTIYLWFFDAERTRQLVLDDSYKAMTRLLQRRAEERRKYSSVIGKSERSDVQGNEAKFLSETELAALKKWRAMEAKILVQLQRLDEGVLTLRDLLPPNALHYA